MTSASDLNETLRSAHAYFCNCETSKISLEFLAVLGELKIRGSFRQILMGRGDWSLRVKKDFFVTF